MTQTALAFNTTTGDIWRDTAPQQGAWDSFWQLFSYTRSPNAQDATPAEKEQIRAYLRHSLTQPPRARRPAEQGIISAKPIQIACAQCLDTQVVIPVKAACDPAHDFWLGWFGIGTCTCPACNTTSASAKIKGLGLYEFSDFIRMRDAHSLEKLAIFT